MTVLIRKSTCIDCMWKDSCLNLKKINDMKDSRDHHNHPNDVFEAIIVNCSVKNYDRSYNGGNGKSAMYYCEECGSMHHEWSRIGKTHKRIL